MTLTLQDRAQAYARACPEYPASWPSIVLESGHQCLYARWVLGNDYKNKTRFYGAFPPGFLPRLMCLFPELPASATDVWHVFSGSLPPGPYVRCDVAQPADVQCDVCELPQSPYLRPKLIVADPPYSADDAKQYGTPMIERRRVLAALAAFIAPTGHLAWLDCVWPMHQKAQWRTVARIAITRSTNHRVRDLTIFQRVA